MIAAGILEVFRKDGVSIPSNLNTNGEEYSLTYQSNSAQFLFAEDNISGCASIDNYNPYAYLNYTIGLTYPSEEAAAAAGYTITEEPANCWQTCSTKNTTTPTRTLSMNCISCDPVPIKSTLNVMWQVPQFLLVGISEILASVTTLEFFYSQAPESMRSFTAALNLFTTALGSWLCIPIILLVNLNPQKQWLP